MKQYFKNLDSRNTLFAANYFTDRSNLMRFRELNKLNNH